MGTEQYTVGVVTSGRTESTIRFITYYANNVALWEAGKEAKLVSKICAEDIAKDLCMSGTDRKSTRLNSSHRSQSRMPSSA